MAITFSAQDITYSLQGESKIKQWITEVVENKGFKLGDLHFIFCSDKYIIESNRQFLSHDYATDIITFDYSSRRKISGDILISIPTVRANAQRFESSFKNELLRVIIHGVLHLMGFKDSTEAEQNEMKKGEDLSLLLYETNFQ